VDDLVQFLRARLDEDEALALEAPQGPWHIGNAVDPTKPCNVHTFPGARPVADGLNWLVAEHIARHDPAHVLAEVEAKRRIVDLAAGMLAAAKGDSEVDHYGGLSAAEETLLLLARPFRDHPDFGPAWLEN
jgi:hypothetical protein